MLCACVEHADKIAWLWRFQWDSTQRCLFCKLYDMHGQTSNIAWKSSTTASLGWKPTLLFILKIKCGTPLMFNGKIMNNNKNCFLMQEKAADSLDSARRKPRARNTRTHKNGPKKSHNYASTQHTALCSVLCSSLWVCFTAAPLLGAHRCPLSRSRSFVSVWVIIIKWAPS